MHSALEPAAFGMWMLRNSTCLKWAHTFREAFPMLRRGATSTHSSGDHDPQEKSENRKDRAWPRPCTRKVPVQGADVWLNSRLCCKLNVQCLRTTQHTTTRTLQRKTPHTASLLDEQKAQAVACPAPATPVRLAFSCSRSTRRDRQASARALTRPPQSPAWGVSRGVFARHS